MEKKATAKLSHSTRFLPWSDGNFIATRRDEDKEKPFYSTEGTEIDFEKSNFGGSVFIV